MSDTHGTFVWYDVMTTDAKAAEAFYRGVIGWDAQDSGMPDRSYTLLFAGPAMRRAHADSARRNAGHLSRRDGNRSVSGGRARP